MFYLSANNKLLINAAFIKLIDNNGVATMSDGTTVKLCVTGRGELVLMNPSRTLFFTPKPIDECVNP